MTTTTTATREREEASITTGKKMSIRAGLETSQMFFRRGLSSSSGEWGLLTRNAQGRVYYLIRVGGHDVRWGTD